MANTDIFPEIKLNVITQNIEFRTLVSEFDDGTEQRRKKWSTQRRLFTLGHSIMPKADIETLWDFYRAREGRFDNFQYRNPQDFEIIDEDVGVGDGSPSQVFFLDVPPIIAGSITITVAAVPETGFTLTNALTGEITFDSSTPTGVIIASYENRIICRFNEDIFSAEMFEHLIFNNQLSIIEEK